MATEKQITANRRNRRLRENLIKIGANVVRHSTYVTFQMAEVVNDPYFTDLGNARHSRKFSRLYAKANS